MEVNFKKFILKLSKNVKGHVDFNDNEKFWPVFMASLALLLTVSFGPDLVDFAQAATGSVALNVTIASTLTFNMDATTKGFGSLTAGTPVQATSALWITTNNAIGHNTTINRASTTATLSSGSQTISDNPNNNNWTAPVATSTAGPSAVWTNGTTKGLGFRVVSSGTDIGSGASTTCGAAPTWWGATDDGAAQFSGVSTSTSAQKIANCNEFLPAGGGQTVVYKLDVTSTQAAGVYTSSPITYTVLVN